MVLNILSFLLSCLPRRLFMQLASLLACVAWWVMVKRRRIAIQNIETAFGKQPTQQLAFETFKHFSAGLLECLVGQYWSKPYLKQWIRLAKGSSIEDLKQPCLAVTGHIGQWELFPLIAEGVKFVPIYQKFKSSFWDGLLYKLRCQIGVSGLIDKAQFSSEYQTILSQDNCLAFLADQGRGPQHLFMGQMTCFPRSIAHIAYRSKRPVIFGLGLRNGLYIDYHLSKPICIGDNESKVAFQKRLVSAYIDWLETWVRQYPQQYLWLHDLWKKNRQSKVTSCA